MAGSTAIAGGRVVPVEGEPIEGGTVLVRDGKIAAVEGPGFTVPDGVDVVDASGKWVLPGFIDAHAHAGVHEEAEGWAGQDTNERTDPNAAHVRALDAINPADQGFRDAITGGVLAVNVNPGSANPIGGQTAAIKCWGRTVDEMVLREPAGVKSALGENPKRIYGERKQTPSTRLGTAAVIRGALVDAANYLARVDAEQRKSEADRKPVDRDLKLERERLVSEREKSLRKQRQALALQDRGTMMVASAQIAEADAQIALVDDKLARAVVVAPFQGIVVSGDLDQLLRTPVEQGKLLFQIAPLDAYRVILEVDERDIANVQLAQTGQLTLSGLPDQRMIVDR